MEIEIENVGAKAERDEKGRLIKGSKMHRPKSKETIQRQINRELLAKALTPSIGMIADDLASLSSFQRLQALSALLPYVQPKLSSVELIQLPAISDLLELSPTDRAKRIREIKQELRDKEEAAKRRGATIIKAGK